MARFVLVHGFTQTGRSWGVVEAALTDAGHEVLTPDLPGHGSASHVAADLSSGADGLARQGGNATYVGYSMGGRFCLHVADRHPDVVERLVLISTSAGIDDPAARAVRRTADEARADELEAAGDEGLPAWLERWLAQPLFATLPAGAAGLEARLANTATGLASSLRLAGTGTQEPLWSRLSGLTMPVLVVAGEHDATYTALARRLAEAIGANARLAVVAGAGHAVHLEQPAVLVELVLDWR
jgi:2-succinyl-6-hydroxy-2,4-cyclohexadiene-1-carboxylate synthase